eukprot:NODE_751_length_1371_cov_62.234493_g551_i0.p1 GENE.NODE_751_length_1371_cov_62.234493_g551_i0~~NODE_751_length_1371_cov_62.234493_g551_i0.p1  ORF type:complete len:259 (-),score=57.37 NODE_751_length_1371_cov_62.234493_g551_i0:595-1296(-)
MGCKSAKCNKSDVYTPVRPGRSSDPSRRTQAMTADEKRELEEAQRREEARFFGIPPEDRVPGSQCSVKIDQAKQDECFKEEFATFDVTQDNRISVSDMHALLRDLGVQQDLGWETKLPELMLPGYLDWRKKILLEPDFAESMEDVFCVADTDLDGVVTANDIIEFTALWKGRPGKEDAEDIVKAVSRGGAAISRADFEMMMHGNIPEALSLEQRQWVCKWRCLSLMYTRGYFT